MRQIRIERGLGVRELARLVGCSPAYIVQIESGQRIPSAKLLRKIARTLRVSFDDLTEVRAASGN